MNTAVLLCLLSGTLGINFDASSASSVEDGTSLIIKGMLDYYPPASSDSSRRLGATIGIFQAPYYWWEAGVAWGVMIDWQFVTGNDSYTDMIKDAMTYQAGKQGDYMPSNQSLTEGNDDQGFWGLAAMTAAERNFSNPSSEYHSWLYSAQAVFNDMKSRWETSQCGGGLRWQIYTWNSGYDYKNTVSNGCFFNLAARLAHYTGNSTYADWAEKIFNWLVDVKFVDTTQGDSWPIYDGADMKTNCTDHTAIEWTYNSGLIMSGAAYMYSFTNGSSAWDTRARNLWSYASSHFFKDDIIYEVSCQPYGRCNNDQRVFKGIMLQLLGQSAVLIPDLQDSIMKKINASALGAAGACSGGIDGHTCGLNWLNKSYDNNYGLGEQISALSAMVSTQVLGHPQPYTAHNGGTSNGSTEAGTDSIGTRNPLANTTPITTADKAGAGVVTAVLMIFLICVGVWILA